LYVPRKQGGEGLMQLEEAYIVEVTKLMEYVGSIEDSQIQIVRTHQHKTNSAMLQTARSLKRELQRGTRQIKDSIAEKTNERWQGKRMHGQFPCHLDEKLLDNEQWYRMLKFGNIMGDTDSPILAA
jgi:hypothetical protein